MIIEMNPEPDGVLDSNAGINNDGFELDERPDLGPGTEPDSERDDDDGLSPGIEYVPRGAELRAALSQILSKASELQSLSYHSSEARDEQVRRRRTQLQWELSAELDKLRRDKAYLDKEVARCERNLDCIRADLERLNLPEPMEYYADAEHLQHKQYYEAVWDRDALQWAITRVQSALGSSPITSFPERDPFPPDIPICPTSAGPTTHTGGLGNEVEGLLSLGRLAKS